MTMRTYRYFRCPNGHEGVEKTTENDQPYSTSWESVALTGLTDLGKNNNGYDMYLCTICGSEMTFTPQTRPA